MVTSKQLKLIKGGKKASLPLERDLVQAIRDGLTRIGIVHWSGRLYVHGGHPPYLPVLGPGTPDILGVFRGARLFGIEAKRSLSDVTSPAQLQWHWIAAQQGIRVYVARDVDEALKWAAAQQTLA